MTGLSLDDSDRLALATAGVAEGPDGSLRSASGAIVSPGVAAALISRGDGLGKAQSQPDMHPVDPQDYQRGYITTGHAADSPANRHRAQPMPMPDPANGGRSTTPPDAGDSGAPGDAGKVAKVWPDLSRRDVVDWGAALASENERLGGPAGPQPPPDWRQVEPETYHRGPLTEDHATPSPGDQPGNSPVAPVTGSGHERYEAGAQAYNANRAA